MTMRQRDIMRELLTEATIITVELAVMGVLTIASFVYAIFF